MPLIHTFSPEKDCLITLWQITENFEQLLFEYGITEQEEFVHISHPEKKIEYLASRLLLKKTCELFNIGYSGLIKDEHNKPFFETSTCHLSLSHSRDYCVVILHRIKSVGIDIQAFDPKLKIIAPKYLSAKEIFHLGNNVTEYTLAWAAKEAAYKLIGKKGVSLKDQIEINDIHANPMPVTVSLYENTYHLDIHIYTIEQYKMCFCCF